MGNLTSQELSIKVCANYVDLEATSIQLALMPVSVSACLNVISFCTSNFVGHRILNGNYFLIWV